MCGSSRSLGTSSAASANTTVTTKYGSPSVSQSGTGRNRYDCHHVSPTPEAGRILRLTRHVQAVHWGRTPSPVGKLG